MRNSLPILFSLGLALSAIASAADAFTETWKFDPSRSKSTGSQSRSEIYTLAPEGSDGVAITKDEVSSNGAAHHITGTCKFDGKDYPVTGHPLPDATRAVRRINSHTWETTLRSAGTVVREAREVVSDDGNTLTATGRMTLNGNMKDFTTVYTRQ